MATGTSYETKINRRYPEEKLDSFMETHRIDHLFLRSIFENHLQSTLKNDPNHYLTYQQGRAHLNEAGNLLMTKALLDHLSNRGIITKLIEKTNDFKQTDINDS